MAPFLQQRCPQRSRRVSGFCYPSSLELQGISLSAFKNLEKIFPKTERA